MMVLDCGRLQEGRGVGGEGGREMVFGVME